MESLIIREVPDADAVFRVSGLLTLPEMTASHIVVAGAHTIQYDYQSEISFGPALYRATIVGPMASEIARELGKHLVFAPKSPYQPKLGWYAIVEWYGHSSTEGSSGIRILDLICGKILSTHLTKAGFFAGWRGGQSSEYIVQEYSAIRCCDWFACDAQTGNKRLVFRGGYEGHLSEDGRYLLVLHTRADVFVALISIDSGNVLDLKEAVHFQPYVQRVTGLDTVSFDPHRACLTSMLNWTRTDYQTKQVTFQKLITIEVSNRALGN